MIELNTPYENLSGYTSDDGVSVASITDCNGFHVFDCFQVDADELIKRINEYDQLKARIAELEMALNFAGEKLILEGNIPSFEKIDAVLCKEPPQSLAEHDAKVVESLEPTPEMKAQLMGDFGVTLPMNDEDGNEFKRKVNIPWVVMKDIWRSMNKLAANNLRNKGKNAS